MTVFNVALNPLQCSSLTS